MMRKSFDEETNCRSNSISITRAMETVNHDFNLHYKTLSKSECENREKWFKNCVPSQRYILKLLLLRLLLMMARIESERDTSNSMLFLLQLHKHADNVNKWKNTSKIQLPFNFSLSLVLVPSPLKNPTDVKDFSKEECFFCLYQVPRDIRQWREDHFACLRTHLSSSSFLSPSHVLLCSIFMLLFGSYVEVFLLFCLCIVL